MRIFLLVWNDDLICREIVSKFLECGRYRELCTGRLKDALDAFWENKNAIYLVLTNLHRLGEMGLQLINQIRHKYQAEIIYMTPDDKRIEWKGEEMSFSVYDADVSNIDELNKLWNFALAIEKAASSQEGTSAQPSEARLESTPLVGDDSGIYQQRKRQEPTKKSEQTEASGGYLLVEKKPRVVWTKEMNKKFLEAIEALGPDRSFPRNIVEFMNEPGVMRESVASHLQKYRMCLKRNLPGPANYWSGMEPGFPSLQSALFANPFQRYPFQHGSGGSTSMTSLGLFRPFTGSGSSISQEDNFVHSANPQGSDQGRKMQMQSKYHTKSSSISYGNETKNMLMSTEESSSSSNATMPSDAENIKSFVGLRLTSDMSLKFGGNETEMVSFQGSDQQDKVSDYCPSIFSDSTFELESFLASLDSPVEENIPCTSGKPAEFASPSPLLSELPTNWNSNLTLPANFLNPELRLPPLLTSGNVNSLQYPSLPPSGAYMDEVAGPSSSTFTHGQEISFLLLGTSGHGTSVNNL